MQIILITQKTKTKIWKIRHEKQEGRTDSDSEDEDFWITFPTKRDLEKQYFFLQPILDNKGKPETEIEMEIKEKEGEALPNEEPIRREKGQDDVWITSEIRKNVEKRLHVLEQQQANGQTQANNLNHIDLVRLNLLSQIHPFITECQK